MSPAQAAETARHPPTEEEVGEGDRVVYHPVGASPVTSVGRIKHVMTHPEMMGERGIRPHATPEEPRYVIENEHTGKEAPYKREAIVEKLTPEGYEEEEQKPSHPKHSISHHH